MITSGTTFHDGAIPARVNAGYRATVASFIPAALMAYNLVVFHILYMQPGDLAADQDYFLNRLVFPGLFLAALALFLAERPPVRLWRCLPVTSLAAFCLLCLASVTWALAPDVTLNKSLLLIMSLGAVGISTLVAGSVQRCLKPLFWVVFAGMALNLAVVLLTPPGPIGHQGIYSHKNTLGAYCALGVLFGIAGMASRRSLYKAAGLFTIAACLLMLVESLSKTALLLAVLAPAMAFAMLTVKRLLRIALHVQIVLALGALLFWVQISNAVNGPGIAEVSTAISGEPTFTGRTHVWDFALEYASRRPFLGYGYHSFWAIGAASPSHRAEPGFIHVTPHAHNGYIDTMLGLGFVGLALLALILISAIGTLDRMTAAQPKVAFICLGFICLPLLHNLLETTWFEPIDATMLPLVLVLFAPAVSRQPTGERHEW